MDNNYQPPRLERRCLFGLQLEQRRNDAIIDRHLFSNAATQAKQVSTVDMVNHQYLT